MKPRIFLDLQRAYSMRIKGFIRLVRYLNPRHTLMRLETDRLISLIPKNVKSVVNFGFGNGRLTIPFLNKGLRVTAVDIDISSLKQFKKYL